MHLTTLEKPKGRATSLKLFCVLHTTLPNENINPPNSFKRHRKAFKI